MSFSRNSWKDRESGQCELGGGGGDVRVIMHHLLVDVEWLDHPPREVSVTSYLAADLVIIQRTGVTPAGPDPASHRL